MALSNVDDPEGCRKNRCSSDNLERDTDSAHDRKYGSLVVSDGPWI